MEPTEIAVARAAYNAYNAGGDPATANKNSRGEPCPAWDDLPQNIRDKWVAAMAPSAETLDGACRWRDDALAEWRKIYPCPRGCGTMGQCIDPATMRPAICPVCYNETPASATARKPMEVNAIGHITAIRSDTFDLNLDTGGRVDLEIGTMDPAVLVGLLEVPCDVAITMRPRKKYIDNGRTVWLPDSTDAP